MDAIEIRHALGAAYTRAQVAGDRHGAVAVLRSQFADPAARAVAEQHRRELAEIVVKRSQGGRCGCYLTKAAHDLLADALKEEG